jgi:hypothetical protein
LEVERFRPKRDQKKAIKRVIMIAYDRIEGMTAEVGKSKKEDEGKHKNGKNQGS